MRNTNKLENFRIDSITKSKIDMIDEVVKNRSKTIRLLINEGTLSALENMECELLESINEDQFIDLEGKIYYPTLFDKDMNIIEMVWKRDHMVCRKCGIHFTFTPKQPENEENFSQWDTSLNVYCIDGNNNNKSIGNMILLCNDCIDNFITTMNTKKLFVNWFFNNNIAEEERTKRIKKLWNKRLNCINTQYLS